MEGPVRRTFSFSSRWLIIWPLLWAVALPGEGPERRARPPKWTNVPPGIFFEDAFREGLSGPRPRRPATGGDSAPTEPDQDEPASASSKESPGWSETISADTIEDEIKAILGRINELVANAGQFKEQGYRQARREYTIAAMLFAIIDGYEDTVRWKPHASAARDSFAQAAVRAKVGSDAVYQQAQQLQISLQDLVRGGGFAGQAEASSTSWSEVCQRGPLMQRLQVAQGEKLSSWLTSANQFQSQPRRILHEAHLVAAMAEVLMRESMEDAADDDYREFCRAMKQAAQEISRAVEQSSYESARQSEADLRRSCDDCHATYRA
jgi:hypothetical protein